MKRHLPVLLMLCLVIPGVVSAQSSSFQVLKDNFGDREDVYALHMNGLFCRAVLSMAGEWEFNDAIDDISSIRLITIPNQSFQETNLSVGGFKKYLKKDNFELLATVNDHGDEVEIYVQLGNRKQNRYLILAKDRERVTAVELKGYIDVNKLQKRAVLSYNEH